MLQGSVQRGAIPCCVCVCWYACVRACMRVYMHVRACPCVCVYNPSCGVERVATLRATWPPCQCDHPANVATLPMWSPCQSMWSPCQCGHSADVVTLPMWSPCQCGHPANQCGHPANQCGHPANVATLLMWAPCKQSMESLRRALSAELQPHPVLTPKAV